MNYRDPAFLRNHMRSILNFYHPDCIDNKVGGYINQFLDDGTIFDHSTKHLVGTCRFIYNYSLGALVFEDEAYRGAAAHGIHFLQDAHRQQVGNEHGGYAWVLQNRAVEDATRHCYGHAFVLLAAAGAVKAGVDAAKPLLADITELLEVRFWEADAQLYVDEIAADDWANIQSYRGQNANMHMCEAMLAAYEATHEHYYLERAYTLANRLCIDLAKESDDLIWEHFTKDWQHDWDYNKEDPQNLFRPYGYLPGHFAEWAKLLLLLEQLSKAAHFDHDWMLPKAQMLFDVAVNTCWDFERGGMHYAFAPEGRILDTDRYYWVLSETFAAAAALAARTGDERYWAWYDKIWSYSDRYFVDHEYGGWFRVLGMNGQKLSNEKSPAAKTDYHPLAACYETLKALKSLSGYS